jgi:hypothetical protein
MFTAVWSLLPLLLVTLLAGHFKCDSSVIVGRPVDRQQLANLVKVMPHLKGAGQLTLKVKAILPLLLLPLLSYPF